MVNILYLHAKNIIFTKIDMSKIAHQSLRMIVMVEEKLIATNEISTKNSTHILVNDWTFWILH